MDEVFKWSTDSQPIGFWVTEIRETRVFTSRKMDLPFCSCCDPIDLPHFFQVWPDISLEHPEVPTRRNFLFGIAQVTS